MSSSSSDSDSDDLEPVRRIKINIKPKEDVAKREGADVEAIKASVDAWRPLGLRPHQALTRRQSSLSSVSSLTFGTGSAQGGSGSTTATSSTGAFNYSYHGGSFGSTSAQAATPTITRGNDSISNQNYMRSSPSCSSLVNEFNNRTTFSNFMSNASRTSSPLNFMSNIGDTVPIAIAIQESIELTVKGQQGPNLSETKFETRALGNIKVAFPKTFARSCSSGCQPSSLLKLRLHSTENILRYYASGLIRDLDSESSSLTGSLSTSNKGSIDNDVGTIGREDSKNRFIDLFDMNESPNRTKGTTKIIEFDMEALMKHLKQLYDQTPDARYYNVDVLRYQITPIDQFEKCPIQVCAYWRVEPKLIKLRIDFKHSNQSGLNLERLREIVFNVDLSNFVPSELNVQTISPNVLSIMRFSRNESNNSSRTSRNFSMNTPNSDRSTTPASSSNIEPSHCSQPPSMQDSNHQYKQLVNINDSQDPPVPVQFDTQQNFSGQQQNHRETSRIQILLPPPPSKSHSRGGSGTLSRPTKSGSTMATGSFSNTNNRQQPTSFSSQLDCGNFVATTNQDWLSMISDTQPPKLVEQDSQTMFQAAVNRHLGQPEMRTNALLKPITTSSDSVSHGRSQSPSDSGAPPPIIPTPFIAFDPLAHWDQQTRQLTWKFDNLLSYYKTDGYGSLLTKLDFRNCSGMQEHLIGQQSDKTPRPVDIKFMVVDATLSKISLSIDSTGYRMSLLKKEVRSGRYKSEPYIF